MNEDAPGGVPALVFGKMAGISGGGPEQFLVERFADHADRFCQMVFENLHRHSLPGEQFAVPEKQQSGISGSADAVGRG